MTEEKNNQNKKEKKEECPLCKISEDTIKKLKERGKFNKNQEKKEK